MVRLVIRVRDKDVGMLRRAAHKAGMSQAQYVEEAMEVWLSRERKEETWTAEERRGHLSSTLTASAVVSLK